MAGQRGGGPAWRLVLLLAGYLLLAPPVFVLGPLAGLLLVSGPSTMREWLWVLVAGLSSVFWLQEPGGLTAQFVRAAAVLLTGGFLGLALWRPSPGFGHAAAATAIAAAALGLWMAGLDIGWDPLHRAVLHDLRLYHGRLAAGLPKEYADQMAAMTDTASAVFPALLALAGIGGLCLAWAWYHRLAERPLGEPPGRFTEFHFSDQLVWGGVLALALCLLPVPAPGPVVGANLLLVMAVLYAARGLAVFAAGTGRVPRPLVAALTLVAMVLLPFVVGGLTLLGLADTWLDFRRRLAAPATGG